MSTKEIVRLPHSQEVGRSADDNVSFSHEVQRQMGSVGDNSPAVNSLEPIRLKGHDRATKMQMLRLFYWIGVAYEKGARSYREVSDLLSDCQIQRRCPIDIPTGHTEVSKCAFKARRFFCVEHFQLGREENVFESEGERSAARGFTDFGYTCWKLTRDFLSQFEDLHEFG